MEKSRFNLALLIPVLAVVIIASFGGGLGVTFMLLDHYGPEIDGSPVLVVVLGMSLVVGVPTVAAILERPSWSAGWGQIKRRRRPPVRNRQWGRRGIPHMGLKCHSEPEAKNLEWWG